MMSKKKLGKLSMPEKRSDEMDLSELDSEPSAEESNEEAAEFPESGEEAPEEASSEEHSYLAKCSDDELMAELKKRGLDKELASDEAAAGESEADQDYSMGS